MPCETVSPAVACIRETLKASVTGREGCGERLVSQVRGLPLRPSQSCSVSQGERMGLSHEPHTRAESLGLCSGEQLSLGERGPWLQCLPRRLPYLKVLAISSRAVCGRGRQNIQLRSCYNLRP